MELHEAVGSPDRSLEPQRDNRPDPGSTRTGAQRQDLAERVAQLEAALAGRDQIIVGMSRELVAARSTLIGRK